MVARRYSLPVQTRGFTGRQKQNSSVAVEHMEKLLTLRFAGVPRVTCRLRLRPVRLCVTQAFLPVVPVPVLRPPPSGELVSPVEDLTDQTPPQDVVITQTGVGHAVELEEPRQPDQSGRCELACHATAHR